MENILIKDVIKAVNGVLINPKNIDNLYINGVSTDSRTIEKNNLFVPIAGEHFDGHNFITDCCKKGAFCLTENKEADIIENYMVIYVKSTIEALGSLAKFYCSKILNADIIAITGSVGKTTTKDMIASVLNQKYTTLKTEGNYNNEIGLPLTLFKGNKQHNKIVLEMGMSQFGEIDYLSSIANPDTAIITNIGVSHIENLGSRQNILKAKSEIFNYLNSNSKIVLNSDDDMLLTLQNKFDNILWYGIDNKRTFYADNIKLLGLDGVNCDIHFNNNTLNINIPSPGKHMVYVALCAFVVGYIHDIDFELIKKGIESFVPSNMRMNIINNSNFTIINDAYNASPQSMKSALDVLKNCSNQRKVAILGDMYEIGEQSEQMHREIGKYAVDCNIDVIICVGDLAKYIYNEAYSNKNENQIILYFDSKQNLYDKLFDILKKYDIILIKASRGMHLEQTIDKIEKVEF